MVILADLAQIKATEKMGAWITLFQYGVCTYLKDNFPLESCFGEAVWWCEVTLAHGRCCLRGRGTLTQESLLPYKPAPVPPTAGHIVTPRTSLIG